VVTAATAAPAATPVRVASPEPVAESLLRELQASMELPAPVATLVTVASAATETTAPTVSPVLPWLLTEHLVPLAVTPETVATVVWVAQLERAPAAVRVATATAATLAPPETVASAVSDSRA
jgi:hypothetical protein